MENEYTSSPPPIQDKVKSLLRGNGNGGGASAWWDKYRNLFWIVILLAAWIMSYSVQSATVQQSKARIEQDERDIVEIKQFIAAQKVTNVKIEEIRSDVSEIRKYLMEKK